MQTRWIGSLEVSAIGLGCNNFGGRLDAAATAGVVHAALDAGVTLFDTADIYGGTRSEEFLGKALGVRRKEIILATKFGMVIDEQRRGANPAYVRRALEDSLRRLGTDCIDLYQLHTPDPTVPIEETLGALDDLVKAGKVREIGCSQFDPGQLRAASEAAARRKTARFVSVQNEFSLLRREPEQGVLAEAERLHMAFIPFFPLASGLLTGKYRLGQPAPPGTRLASGPNRERTMTDANLHIVDGLVRFAEARGHTMLELAVSWLLSHAAVASVIAGATSGPQVTANVASGAWPLTGQELAEIDRIAPRAS